MNHAPEKQNPGWHRGFAQSTCRLVAFTLYRIGLARANACVPVLPFAFDGTGYGAALLWGGLP